VNQRRSEGEKAADAGSHSLARVEAPGSDAEEIQRFRTLPKEFALLFIVAGISGLLLPGPVGTPFLLVGGVMLWPRAFERVESWFERRFPRVHHQSVRQMRRFVDDLERRYPQAR
jgi:hypothetical protein